MDKKKILVVDDENDVLLMLEKRLTAEGDEGPGDRFGFAG